MCFSLRLEFKWFSVGFVIGIFSSRLIALPWLPSLCWTLLVLKGLLAEHGSRGFRVLILWKLFHWHDSESHLLLPSISYFLKKGPTPHQVPSPATFLFLGTLLQFSKCFFFFHPLQLTHWVFICPALGYWLISSIFIESLASSCFCLIVSFAHRFPALYGPRCFVGIASAQLSQRRMAPLRSVLMLIVFSSRLVRLVLRAHPR